MTPERWRQISAIFNAAKQRHPADQAAFVVGACRGDDALHREVSLLLRAHQNGAGFGSSPIMPSSYLQSGSSLCGYRIESLLGAGGMGEVYRARDSKLDRSVAIKILPDSFAHDPERLARFEREAKTLAALNHPNIAIIHSFEEEQGIQALVMELIEGPTLADRIAQRAIPVGEALPIARQIAEALEVAHEHGIVHRDLNPANIKVRPDGTVKILDFGLAKALEPTSDRAIEAIPSPAITSPARMTSDGILIGTAAYMSPEQANGRAADKRSDIWAFGCVLYEMLTGKRAFKGENVVETLSAVLKSEPDWTLLPAELPHDVQRLVRLCLEKNVKNRRSDAADVRLDIEGASKAPTNPTVRPARSKLALIVAGVMMLIAAVLAGVNFSQKLAAPPEMRLEITTPVTSSPLDFALSPDGRSLVFVASGDGPRRVWLRALDKTAALPMTGTEGASYPFWSADSRSVGFFANGKLQRIDVAGGPPAALADAPAGRGGAWNPDGTILFTASQAGPLLRVSAKAGEPVVVTRIVEGQLSHRFPQFLPDGRHFLFFVQGSAATQGIYWGSLDGGEPRRVVASDTAGAWAPPDRLLFVRQGALVATPFDTETGEITGEPITVADPVGVDAGIYHGGFSVSAEGGVAYRAGSERRQLTWFERDGKRVGTAGAPDETGLFYPELSPDGNRLAVTRARVLQNNADIWLIDLARGGSATRFTFDPAFDYAPLWSSDGLRIAFQSNRKGSYDVYVKPSSGGPNEEVLLESAASKSPLSWSSDGKFLLFYQLDPKTNYDLWTLPLKGDGKPSPWLNTVDIETLGQFSPNGRWVAYQSNESGPFEIYVQPFPTANAKWPISTHGGTMPRWRPDGKELFFIAPDAKLMAVAVTASNTTFEAAPPVALFQTRIVGDSPQILKHQYAVSPDGRFLINETAEPFIATPITLIINWKR